MVYGTALTVLCVLAGALAAVQRRHLATAWGIADPGDDTRRLGDFDAAARFQRNWLSAFALAQLANWMQQPFLFRLYASFGFDHSEVVTLFLVTYASSAVFGTLVGAAADRYGRKRGCLLYVALFVLSTLAKCNTPSWGRLSLCHIVDGVALSLLYTAFESWMVSENFISCFPQNHLHRTFELGSILNGAIAVLAGVLSSIAAGFAGNFGPFAASIVPVLFSAVLMRDWAENFGEVAGPFKLSVVVDTLRRDRKIVLLGLAQTFFDSAMYVVRYAWMPALAVAVTGAGSGAGGAAAGGTASTRPDEEYAVVFAALMISVMIGGILFSIVRRSSLCISGFGTGTGRNTSFSRVALPAHFVALVCLMGTVALFDSGPLAMFWCFVGVEMAYGYFWPCHGVMRSEFLPETHRATMMNVFLIGRNLVVMFALMYNSYLSSLPSIPDPPKMHGIVVGESLSGSGGGAMGATTVAGAGLAAGAGAMGGGTRVAAASGSKSGSNGSIGNNGTVVFRFLRSMSTSNAPAAMPGGGVQTETNIFMSTILQGHNASRELLLVGVSAFAASLLFAVLLYQKTQVNSVSAHAYSAINLDDSAITDDTEFEEDFGNLIDDQYVDEVSFDGKGSVNNEAGEVEEDDWEGFDLEDDDDDDDDVGFRGVFS
jgi:MFS family permease